MTAPINTKRNALQLAGALEDYAMAEPSGEPYTLTLAESAAELRTQAATIAALEAKLAAAAGDAGRWRYAMNWDNKRFAVCMRLPGEAWDPINTDGPIDAAMKGATHGL